MSNYLLSITIPTYNRKNELYNRITELLPQLSDEVEVVIIDNCSNYIAKEYIYSEIPQSKEKVRFIRNEANIGGNANICRCFEVAHGEWIWTLGDDDSVHPDAVKKILDEVKQNDHNSKIAGITFSSGIYTNPKNLIINSFESLCSLLKDCRFLSNNLFISAQVYKTSLSRNYLIYGYNNINSCGPHMCMMLRMIQDHYEWKCSSNPIIDWIAPPAEHQWSPITVSKGLPLMLESVNDIEQLAKSFNKGLIPHLYGLRLKDLFKNLFLLNRYPAIYWEIYYLRFLPFVSGFLLIKICTMVMLCRIVRLFPDLKRYNTRRTHSTFTFSDERL